MLLRKHAPEVFPGRNSVLNEFERSCEDHPVALYDEEQKNLT
jgi:hypothetical protein